MITECYFCEAKVDATVLAAHVGSDDSEFDTHGLYKISLLECPSCRSSLAVGQYCIGGDDPNPSKPIRLWPFPQVYLSNLIPNNIRESIEEAERCLRGGAYTACVAMSGRALEGVCRHHKTKSKYLGGGLKELKSKGIIDSRLYEWGQELQKHRNIAAHATDEIITKVDAEDLMEFVKAICEYVFVLTEKFNQFMKRKSGLTIG